MVTDRSPTAIDEAGWHWLRVKHVTGFPRQARDGYFLKHDVTRPAGTTGRDLPEIDGEKGALPADRETVSDADRLALETTYLSGKWLVERPPETVDDLWEAVVEDVAAERLWDAKVTTAAGREAFGETDHAVLVFTPNYFDREDVQGIEETVGEAGIVATNQVGMDLETRKRGRQPISVTYTDDPRVVYDVARGEIPRTWRQQAVVSADFARERDLGVDDRFTVFEETETGETKRIYRVTAVLEETQVFGVSEVFLPMSELGERQYTQVEVRTRSVDRAEATAERLRTEYNDRKNRLFVFELTSLVRFFKSIVNGINIFLAGLAAISLLVAGVSIANTMLMAVIKRREEIGVRRAVGYSRLDVVRILLVEAGMLGAIGAVVGVTISLIATMLANATFLGDPFAFTGESVQYLLGAVAFGIVTSLLAGAYPAWRAANERPVDALRD